MTHSSEFAPRPRQIGTVSQIWRYPVKSMAGERLTQAEVSMHGLAEDRLYAFESPEAPPGMLRLSSAQRRTMLLHVACSHGGKVAVTTPEAGAYPVDSPELLAGLGNGLTLTHASKPQTDVRPLSLVSVQAVALLSEEFQQHVGQTSQAALDVRQFRANLVLDLWPDQIPPDISQQGTFPEDALLGNVLQLGESVRIRVLERDPRCRFFSLDPLTGEPQPELMRLLHRKHDGRVGIYAAPDVPGKVAEGDPVWLMSGLG